MTRFDVSAVPPQNAYIAKQCPVRVQNNALRPCKPVTPSRELQRRLDRGVAFEADAVAALEAGAAGIVTTEAESQDELEALPADAIAARSPLIVGGRLPTDVNGRRAGKPDLLVRARLGGYRPVDIKQHMTLEPAVHGRSGLPALCSPTATPSFEEADVDERFAARKREDDLLQLAHYQRMLEAARLAPTDGRWAGIVGTEGRVVWYDLDAPIWRTPSASGKLKGRSTMERYDFEFDFRLDVLARAHDHKHDPAIDLLAVPVEVAECAECPWRDYCGAQLASGSGDVSLLPRVGWREWKIHRDHGIRNRGDLARLDVRTARLVSNGVNVAEMRSLIEDLPTGTPVADLKVVIRSKLQLSRLEEAGVHTFGDLAGLSAATAAYSGSGLTSLPEHIDLARAALGPAPVYRRRGCATIMAPRADIEVDIDMENIEEGVYLWGVLVTQRADGPSSSTYTPFATWEPMTPEVELENSRRFWTWLSTLRADTERAGRTFRAYCYNAAAENTYLRRLGLAGGLSGEVIDFITSTQWVDLLKVVGDQLLTGGGLGLKKIAPLSGFRWPVEDPGGGLSMLRYDDAVRNPDEHEREEAREWLVNYNRGDVEATLAVRDWLSDRAASIEPIEALDDAFADSGSVHARATT